MTLISIVRLFDGFLPIVSSKVMINGVLITYVSIVFCNRSHILMTLFENYLFPSFPREK